jgi:hypothetical protein
MKKYEFWMKDRALLHELLRADLAGTIFARRAHPGEGRAVRNFRVRTLPLNTRRSNSILAQDTID